jgi:anti-sigma factor ChrR (cupin superfamily)
MSGEAQRIVLRSLLGDPALAEWGTFQQMWPGVDFLPLYGFAEDCSPLDRDQPSAAFIRYQPGSRVPEHAHPGYEHILVLRGSQSDHLGHYPVGTCVMSPPGSRHAVYSEEGCLVLAIWNRSVEVVHGK